MNTRERNQAVLLSMLALVWFGVLAGVSFLATPIKFVAPSLSLAVALDVGRQTFAALNLLELILAFVLLVITILQYRGVRSLSPTTGQSAHQSVRRSRAPVIISLSLLVLVLSQTLWLLPVLDARVEMILQGNPPPASSLHLVYIGVDVIKLCLLGLLAGISLSRLRHD
jgi:hypothetical protein